MNHLSKFLAAVLISLFLTITISGCSSMLATMPSIVDGTLDLPNDNDLFFGFVELSIQFDKYSYISLKENLIFLNIDDRQFYHGQNAIITSGKHIIGVKYTSTTFTSLAQTLTPLKIEFVFEPGKFYIIDFNITNNDSGNKFVNIFIEENKNISNKLLHNIEKVKNFVTNRTYNSINIDGTYILESESSITNSTAPKFFTLDKNNFIIHSEYDINNSKFVTYGRYINNDKWLIIFLDNKKIKNPTWYHSDVVPLDSVSVRYIRQDNSLFLQTPEWKHTFMPYTLKYNKIR